MSAIVFASIVLFTITERTFACSPEGYVHRNLVQRMNDAQAALHGEITRTFPDPSWSSAYTAEMRVKCVLKSPDDMPVVPMMVNISEAGSIPGMCHMTNLEVGNEYLVTLRVSNGRFIPDEFQYGPERVAEAALTCGITPRPPTGGSSEMCPDPAEPGQCNEYVAPTPRIGTPPPPPPPRKGDPLDTDIGADIPGDKPTMEEPTMEPPTMKPASVDKPDAVVGDDRNGASVITCVAVLSVILPSISFLLLH